MIQKYEKMNVDFYFCFMFFFSDIESCEILFLCLMLTAVCCSMLSFFLMLTIHELSQESKILLGFLTVDFCLMLSFFQCCCFFFEIEKYRSKNICSTQTWPFMNEVFRQWVKSFAVLRTVASPKSFFIAVPRAQCKY